MEWKSISRTSMVAIPIMIVCGLLVAVSSMGPTARADNEDTKVCTDKNLHGDYGSASEGVLLNVPGLPPEAQFRAVTMTHFDGKGTLTWVEHTVVNGMPLQPGWTPASGTYAVNQDCTGTAVVNTPNSPVPLHLALVVVRQAKEIHAVLDSDAISTVFNRVE